MSSDPIGQSGGINLYTYNKSEPIKNIDINGCDPYFYLWGWRAEKVAAVSGLANPVGIGLLGGSVTVAGLSGYQVYSDRKIKIEIEKINNEHKKLAKCYMEKAATLDMWVQYVSIEKNLKDSEAVLKEMNDKQFFNTFVTMLKIGEILIPDWASWTFDENGR